MHAGRHLALCFAQAGKVTERPVLGDVPVVNLPPCPHTLGNGRVLERVDGVRRRFVCMRGGECVGSGQKNTRNVLELLAGSSSLD